LQTRRAKLRRRGIYLLPNLITTGALFAGFFAIVAGMNDNFLAAALAYSLRWRWTLQMAGLLA
jgi:phosphatidylserine synthase